MIDKEFFERFVEAHERIAIALENLVDVAAGPWPHIVAKDGMQGAADSESGSIDDVARALDRIAAALEAKK
jgi:hypothetical protein